MSTLLRSITAFVALTASSLVTSSVLAFPAADVPKFPIDKGAATQLLAAWTQFAAQPGVTQASKIMQVRFVLFSSQQTCGGVKVVGDRNPGKTAPARLRATIGGQVPRFMNTNTPQPFRAKVCVADLPGNWKSVQLAYTANSKLNVLKVYPNKQKARLPGPAAPSANKTLTGIAMADTGCRGLGNRKRRLNQDCKNDWPFEAMSVHAASKNPDFVMHVGDYHYFEEFDSFWGENHGDDRMEYWLQEFLVPANELLMAAPWIFARGNHETCPTDWFGEGWYKLFSNVKLNKAKVTRKGIDYNRWVTPCDRESTSGTNPAPTWSVDIASKKNPGKVKPWRFVTIDVNEAWAARDGFIAAAKQTNDFQTRNVTWLSHYPAAKSLYYGGRHHNADWNVSNAIQTAIHPDKTATPPRLCGGNQFTCRPRLILSGHQHFYQDVQWLGSAKSTHPRQIIVGNSGTGIDGNGLPDNKRVRGRLSQEPVICQQRFTPDSRDDKFGGGHRAQITTASQHGYLLMQRNPQAANNEGWDLIPQWHGNAPKYKTTSTPCNGKSIN